MTTVALKLLMAACRAIVNTAQQDESYSSRKLIKSDLAAGELTSAFVLTRSPVVNVHSRYLLPYAL